ncbi:MAG: ATP-dependent RecD-like DNA helicase [Lentisphaeria bacterium]|nr:ATP-dependent RecD-like DNA helicase [Lentisphaeria bacterium]
MNDNLLNLTSHDGPQPNTDRVTALTDSTVRGEVLRVVFASGDGQWVVLRLLDEQQREVTLVGPMTGVLEGQDIEATGRWETHRDHGRQLRVREFRAVLPSTDEGVRRYLASGLIPGIGPVYAERIVQHFGAETLTVLDRYSERLREVPGIGGKRVAEIRRAWHRHTQQRDVVIFLQGLGIPAGLCARIVNRYGVAAAEVVRRNPYQTAAEVRGIGFLTADRIAERLGVAKENPLRLAAGIEYVLEQLAQNGHVGYPDEDLRSETARVLGVSEELAAEGIALALRNGRIIREDRLGADTHPMVFLRRLYQAETELAEALHLLLASPPGIRTVPAERLGDAYRKLDAEQRGAVLAPFRHPLSVITGGPGVGKTTVIGQIVAAARLLRLKVLLAAPTGRAAKRMGETTGLAAMTIHRLLQWNPKEAVFVHGPDHPLSCDLLVVDEVSMLDVPLAGHLFRALRPGTRVVLVGDRDQLPSVGPGTVLHDLIACARLPVTHLSRIYRQDSASRIVTNAHAVNRGAMPDLHRVPARARADFYWIEQDEPEHVAALIARMVSERIPRRFGFDPATDVQVLCPMHRGSCGAMALNALLQEALNPCGKRPDFAFGERRFREGDRVMQTVNNYDKGVFNGELGCIRAIDFRAKTVRIEYDIGPVEYEWCDADQIVHAYAVTVHKSQGSEFPAVVMPLLTQHYMMLQRNLVYTGMTRAKSLLVMIGTRRALAIALSNNKPMLRYSRLAPRLAMPPDRLGLD